MALADLPGQWVDKVHQRRPPKTIVLDMDSSESPTYGEQEGSAYNGHFGCISILIQGMVETFDTPILPLNPDAFSIVAEASATSDAIKINFAAPLGITPDDITEVMVFNNNTLRFFADRASKKWPLRGSLKESGVRVAYLA